MHKRWVLFGEDLQAINCALKYLRDDVGSILEAGTESNFTLWATLGSISTAVDQTRDDMDLVMGGIQYQANDIANISGTVILQGSAFSYLSNKFRTMASSISAAVTDYSTARIYAQTAKDAVSYFQNTGGYGDVSKLTSRFNDFDGKMSRAEFNFGNLTALVEGLVTHTSLDSKSPSVDVSEYVFKAAYNTNMANVKITVDELWQAVVVGGVIMVVHIFNSYMYTLAFVQSHFPDDCYQFFVDIVSLLQRIDDTVRYDQDVQQVEVHYVQVNQIPEKLAVVASLQTEISPILAVPKESHEQKHIFSAMKYYESWYSGDGSTGTLNRINQTLYMRVESMRNNIQQFLEARIVARNICLEMLTSNQEFWRELCSEISEFNRLLLVS